MDPRVWRRSRRQRSGSVWLAALLAVACSSKSGEAPTSASVAPQTSSEAVPRFDDEALVADVPERVEDMADAIPAEATFAAVVPSAEALDLPPELLGFLKERLVEEVAGSRHADRALLQRAVDHFAAAAIFGLGDAQEDAPLTIAVRFREGAGVEEAIAAMGAIPIGAHTWQLEVGDRVQRFTWLQASQLLIGSASEAGLRASLSALAKRSASFRASGTERVDPQRIFVFGDLHRLVRDEHFLAPGAQVVGALSLSTSGLRLALRGDRTPELASLLAPHAHDALAGLPGSPAIALDLSLRRQPGRTLREVLAAADRADPSYGLRASVDRVLAQLGVSLEQLEAIVGDSLTLALYPPPRTDEGETPGAAGSLAMLAIADDAAAKALWTAAKQKQKLAAIRWEGDTARLELGPERSVRVELEPSRLLVTVGAPAAVDAITALRKNAPALGTSPLYAQYEQAAAPSSQLTFFTNSAELTALLPKFPFSVGSGEAMAGDVSFEDQAGGTDLRMQGAVAVALLGGGLAFLLDRERGPRPGLKVHEARQTVRAIARAASAAFARSDAKQKTLCKSAGQAVPLEIPARGSKYTPLREEGKDFLTGDARTGWKCLGFTLTNPTRFRFDYRAGGGYKCPQRGGVDPGPNGFEASAEGDLDGDGMTSLFCATGTIEDGAVMLHPKLFTVDELE